MIYEVCINLPPPTPCSPFPWTNVMKCPRLVLYKEMRFVLLIVLEIGANGAHTGLALVGDLTIAGNHVRG